MKFYLIRHGETDWNVQGLLQGHSDIPLNEKGREQARIAAKALADKGIRRIYSSDLRRAQETATILGDMLGLQKPSTHKELREIYLGEAEGIQRLEIATKYGEEFFTNWGSSEVAHHELCFPKGETKKIAIARFTEFMEAMKARAEAPFAVVSHGLIIRTWMCAQQPELGSTLKIPNLCALEVHWQNQPRLLNIF